MIEYFNLEYKYKKPSLTIDQYKKDIESFESYNIKEPSKPLITFLIVAYNEDKLLFRLLDSIVDIT